MGLLWGCCGAAVGLLWGCCAAARAFLFVSILFLALCLEVVYEDSRPFVHFRFRRGTFFNPPEGAASGATGAAALDFMPRRRNPVAAKTDFYVFWGI